MSTHRRIYLDFNATAPLVPSARDAMAEAAATAHGNPSSIHAEGRGVRDRVERARNQVAVLLGRPREQVVFTSGGTEANWLGVMGLAAVAEARGLPRVVMTTPIEHPSLRGAVHALAARGWRVHTLVMKPSGGVELPRIAEVGLVATALVNHEIGTLANELVRWARDHGALLHVDAVQAAGKLDLTTVDADSIAISAHKIGGPQGVGALAITSDEGLPVHDGGHQERGRRPGTENVLGIIGFGAAAAQCDPAAWESVRQLGEMFERGLHHVEPRIRIAGADTARVGGTINASFPGALGESIVVALDLAGIAASTGAACTSGSTQPSPVLLGLGVAPDDALEAVRFSLGRTTTENELIQVLALLPDIVERARRHR